MPFIKQFNKLKLKLNGFFIYIKLKVQNKKTKLLILVDTVAYIRLLLIREPLK